MASTEPEPEPESDTDALRRLEERLDRAAAAAERLLGDAVVAAGGGDSSQESASTQGRPPGESGPGESGPGPAGSGGDTGHGGAKGPPHVPPAGWQVPGSNGGSEHNSRRELDVLLAVLASLRDRIPPELHQRLSEAVREVLLAVRALIDWYLERTERRRAEPTQAQDIPIL